MNPVALHVHGKDVDIDQCPECDASWIGPVAPKELWRGGRKRYSLLIFRREGTRETGYRTIGYMCPECLHVWDA